MSQPELETIISPSGVVIQKSAIEQSFNNILREWQESNDTNAAASTAAMPSPQTAVRYSTHSILSFEDSDDDEQPATKKQRLQQDDVARSAPSFSLFGWGKPNPATVPPSTSVPPTPPEEKSTGVNEKVLKVCATICHQLYHVDSHEEFTLPYNATVDFYTDHGTFHETVPPFAIASYDESLILAWRGSSTLVDWTSNFAYAPVSSSRWNGIAPDLRAHSSYTSLVESDLVVYHDKIMEKINKNKGINQIIFTGHSLGGGLANIAHIIVKSQMEQKNAPWDGKDLTCRTVAFAAPMTILNIESKLRGEFNGESDTNQFLKKVSDNSCNIIYSFDPIPHAVGNLSFLIPTISGVMPDLVAELSNSGSIPGSRTMIENLLGGKVRDVLNKLYPLMDYHHIGKIIHYGKAGAPPVELRDSKLINDLPDLRGKHVIPTAPNGKGSAQQVIDAHMIFPDAFVDHDFKSNKK
jgi:hypothetical protein